MLCAGGGPCFHSLDTARSTRGLRFLHHFLIYCLEKRSYPVGGAAAERLREGSKRKGRGQYNGVGQGGMLKREGGRLGSIFRVLGCGCHSRRCGARRMLRTFVYVLTFDRTACIENFS